MSVFQSCIRRLMFDVKTTIRIFRPYGGSNYLNQRTLFFGCPFYAPEPLYFQPQQLRDIKTNSIQRRFKKSRRHSQSEGKANDELSDDEDESKENPLLMDDIADSAEVGSERVIIDVGSLRLDAFAKVAFGGTRAKIEELFYKGDIYVNGEKPTKKSCDLSIGDEIDIVKQISPEDRSKLDIKRVHIVKLPDKTNEQGRLKVTIDRWQDLTIDAYGKQNE